MFQYWLLTPSPQGAATVSSWLRSSATHWKSVPPVACARDEVRRLSAVAVLARVILQTAPHQLVEVGEVERKSVRAIVTLDVRMRARQPARPHLDVRQDIELRPPFAEIVREGQHVRSRLGRATRASTTPVYARTWDAARVPCALAPLRLPAGAGELRLQVFRARLPHGRGAGHELGLSVGEQLRQERHLDHSGRTTRRTAGGDRYRLATVARYRASKQVRQTSSPLRSPGTRGVFGTRYSRHIGRRAPQRAHGRCDAVCPCERPPCASDATDSARF